MASTIRIAVVDDHPVFREGVSATLSAAGDFSIVGQGCSAADATRVVQQANPEILLLDLHMPGGDPLAAVRQLGKSHPHVKIVILTMSEEEGKLVEAVQAGAAGYILKGVGGSELAQLLRDIYDGAKYVSPGLAARILMKQATAEAKPAAPELLTGLTSREGQIMREVANGLTNKEVARALKLSEKTVKYYMTNIMQKLHARNRTEAVLIATGKSRSGLPTSTPGARES
jgi:two-component system nitrate/nitrite response regulator NarL